MSYESYFRTYSRACNVDESRESKIITRCEIIIYIESAAVV